MKARQEKLDLRHSSENVCFYIGKFFISLATLYHRPTFMQKVTHTHTQTQREIGY